MGRDYTLPTTEVSDVPAAGAEIVFTADKDMLVTSVRFTIVNSATVGNRSPKLIAVDADGNEFFHAEDPTSRTAGQTQKYCFFAGGGGGGAATSGLALPAGGLELRAGDQLKTTTGGLDAADAYSAMVVRLKKW